MRSIIINFALAGALGASSIVSAQDNEAAGEPDKSVYSEASRASDTTSTTEALVGDLQEKVICKRFKITGSRVAAKKVCRTKAEWDYEEAMNRQLVEQRQAQRTREN